MTMIKASKVTIDDLLDVQQPADIQISPSGRQVVYQLKPVCKKGDHLVSSLWAGDFGVEHSARQLTSGLFEDKSPQWSPDGNSVAFISDRAKAGESSAIYILPIGQGGEAYPITDVQKKRGISDLKWSPDGNFIAYLSADEKTSEKEQKDRDKDDVKVFGEDWEFNRLRLLHVGTREVTDLVKMSGHVVTFAWNGNSKEILYTATDTPEIESSTRYGAYFARVSLVDRKSVHITDFKGNISAPVWIDTKHVYFLANVRPASYCSSSAVWRLSLEDKKCTRYAFGEESCALGLQQSKPNGVVHVLVQNGLADEIRILDGSLVYSHSGDIAAWDIAAIADQRSYVTLGISCHSAKIASAKLGKVQEFHARTADGKAPLDFLYATPSQQTNSQKPLPTVVIVHGGPYSRSAIAFQQWQALILSTGRYGVLMPNYRGGSGHGEAYASSMTNGAGTVDYDDVVSCVDEAISRGLADPTRLAVAGWSQGGFMSYLCAARNTGSGRLNGWRFKGAIPGAGITDLDMMSMTADVWTFESELAGGPPWTHTVSNTSARKGSAIWEVRETWASAPPCLLLHGEQDERVPVSQAWAWKRACLEYGVSCELCVYPREPHGVKEHKHVADILTRVQRFVDACIG